jgi:hypothetical protein
MASRFAAVILVGVFIVAGLTSQASAFSEPIPTKISLLKWGGNPPVGKLYKIVSKASKDAPFTLPTGDPVANGGSVEVKVGAGVLQCTLAGGAFDGTVGWKGLGNPAGSKGYKYLNKTAPTSDPCKTVIIKEKVIKIIAKDVGSIALPVNNPPGNPDVSMLLTVDTDEYCALAVGPHFKEKADKLIKMKAQAAPADCARCGDNSSNRPEEECDGTDDSACPGSCILPGGGGGTCGDGVRNGGDECTCAVEQCDGTDAEECQGLCLPNCTCPEPICNNGVKEAGEVCDPAGSTADCPPGEICGGFCTCVTDQACDCGTPDPTMYIYKNLAPVPDSVCGTTDGLGPVLGNEDSTKLSCMGLYFGGGSGDAPQPSMAPDEAHFKFNVSHCYGSDVTFTHTTPAEVTARDCTAGKTCTGGPKDGEPCVRDRDCDNYPCDVQCYFASYLPLTNLLLPSLGTCVGLEISEDSQGAVDCGTGESFSRIPLDAVIHLPLLDQSPSTPGHQSCPICVGGTLNVADSGTCEGGPNSSLPCMPMTTTYDVHDCCIGGGNHTWDCTADSDCPGGTCGSGCTQYPTSLQCPPHPLAALGPGLLLTLDLTTGVDEITADDNGNFCGYCRDVEVESSLCFEGDPDEGPPEGKNSCPDSSVLECRPATYYATPPGERDPADMAGCGDALRCRTDADCQAPYETCQQRNPGAWRDATIRNARYEGSAAGSLTDHLARPMDTMSFFCIPPNFDETIDNSSDAPGPGAIAIIGEARLSPSAAFIDVTSGVID